MEAPDGEKPDNSSIRPVSSLRSHFENLKAPRLSSDTSTPKTTTDPSEVEVEKARPSFDAAHEISRRDVPTPVRAESFPPKARSEEKPLLRQWESEAASEQRSRPSRRPSPPGAPPVMTLQSPVSPPKPLLAVSARPKPFERSISAQRLQNPPANLQSVPHPPVSRHNSRSSNLGPPYPPSANHSNEALVNASRPSFKKPPPVNRAAKPLTPTSSTFNLDPRKNESKERISPFSTPPSSDESPDRGLERPSERRSERQSLQPKLVRAPTAPVAVSAFPPPPSHHAVEARREAAQHAPRQRSQLGPHQRNSPPEKRPSAASNDFTDHPHQRPILRTRHDNEESPSRIQQSKVGAQGVRQSERTIAASQPPARPLETTKPGAALSEFLPPPKRNIASSGPSNAASGGPSSAALRSNARSTNDQQTLRPPQRPPVQTGNQSYVDSDAEPTSNVLPATEFPDACQTNRRPPRSKCGASQIWTHYDTRLFDICGRYVCSTGYITKAWDSTNAKQIMELSFPEREVKITALAFKPGATSEQEGLRCWLGNNQGEIHEVDLKTQEVVFSKVNAHSRREIIKMHRYQNSIWSLDEDSKLYVWLPADQGIPSLKSTPLSFRVSKGHTFSLIVKNYLWFAAGKDIRIYNPMGGDDNFHVTTQALVQPNVGEVSAGAVISNQFDRVYFGHTDGKVTIYSTKDYSCLGIIGASAYKINCLAGAGFYLWAGFNTGMIYVYDTRSQPWKIKKDWQAHENPVANMIVDRSSVWKFGHLQVASIGVDNAIRLWDGMLVDDWLENDMQEHDVDYCDFREIKTTVVTWNAGASTPGSLRADEKDRNFFQQLVQGDDPSDIYVFGFQELVDLEDKKLTAKSLFKGNKKKDSSEQEHMSRQYRAWRDYLVQLLEENSPATESYQLLHTASMVGLFSCIFIKASQRDRVRNLNVAEVKRGLGGLHGNKGAIIIRFVLDDSSLCFINCHLAAGQTQTVNRNNDVTAILEANALPSEQDGETRIDTYIGGGDGSMVMDHEICVLNGDLNYRIDTMSRDTVIKAIKAQNLNKLLERDQLLVSRRRNPGFRLRNFNEQKITFAPTYKYDVGTDRYDTSEKGRSPAWCDRLLYRGVGRMKQLDYRRHEIRVSDHRPVSGTFLMRVKSINSQKRARVWEECEQRLLKVKQRIARDAQLDYLMNVLGVGQKEAQQLIDK